MSDADRGSPEIHARMFEDGNRVSFARPIDADGRAWWIERFFAPLGLTPEGMGELLTKSAPGYRNIRYAFIDGVGQAFRLVVEGSIAGSGEVWFVERTFELQGNFFNADEMFVPDAASGAGLGRRLMGDLIDVAQMLGVDRIKVQARNVGRYAWLRMGFRPDAGSWRDMRNLILGEIYRHEETLGPKIVAALARMVAMGSPETANDIAALTNRVPSSVLRDSFARPVQVPLGKSIFIDIVGDWDGEFVISNPDMMRIAREYLRGGGDG
jgi:GNAT superfamily N-acetyltransferase